MPRRSLLVCAVTAALGVASAPAAATVFDRVHYSGTEEFSDDGCGFPLDIDSSFRGQALLRIDKTGQAFLDKNAFHFRDVHTNPDTGQWFVVRGHGLYHDIRATRVEGNVYEFTAIEAGQPFVIEDSDGDVVVRDRGVIRTTYLFDTLGDGAPGGAFLEDLQTSVHGPHPASTTTSRSARSRQS